LKTQLYDIK